MKKAFIFLVMIIIASVLAIVALRIVIIADSKNQTPVQIPGTEIKLSTESAKLNENAAIARAKELYKYSGEFGITAQLCRYTDCYSNDSTQKNMLVWIVTFHNVETFMTHGGKWGAKPIDTSGDMHVVIDANDGSWIGTIPVSYKRGRMY